MMCKLRPCVFLLVSFLAGCHSGGSRKVGEPCSSNEDCATSSYGQVVCACHDATFNPGAAHDVARCQVGATVGEVCTSGDEGAPEPFCELGSKCEVDASVHKSLCRWPAARSKLGEGCRDVPCQPDLWCDPARLTCGAGPNLPDGTKCDSPVLCRSGYCVNAVCTPPAGRGEPCAPGWASCQPGLVCLGDASGVSGVSGTCISPLPDGAACRGDWTCTSGFCYRDVCTAVPEGAVVCRGR